jgi:hypothetical protein
MTIPTRLACKVAHLAVLGLALAGCANKPVSEMPAASAAPAGTATPTPAARPDSKPAAAAEEKGDVTPMDRAEANAQCWMKYDKANASLEVKAKLVAKCSDEKMKGH